MLEIVNPLKPIVKLFEVNMNKLFTTVIGFFCVISVNVSAAIITVESVKLDSGLNTNNLSAYWDGVLADSSSVITSENILDATLIFNGSANNHSFFKLTAEFGSSIYDTVNFFAGFDAGYGAEIFFNDTMISNVDSNIWWSRNFDKAIDLENLNLTSGLNTFEVFWAENNNSGGNSFELSFDNNERMALATRNLPTIPTVSTATIPEPSSIALFAIALAVIGFTRKNSALLNN
jgi:hypothetical protein